MNATKFDREVGIMEPIHADVREALKYREVDITNTCGFGCKVYEHRVTGERVLAHNSTYGCRRGAKPNVEPDQKNSRT